MTKELLVSIAAAALLAACGSSSMSGASTGQITLSGTGFTPHAGQALRAALVRVSDDATLDLQKLTVAAGGAFSFTFAPMVDLSAAYKVRYWADFNSNDACDDPPTDHQWSVAIPHDLATYPRAPFTYAHNTSFTSVCSFFP